MPVTVTCNSSIDVTETLTGSLLNAADNKFRSQIKDARTLSDTSTPIASKGIPFEIAMTAGAATLDLRAIVHQITGVTHDLNGLKVQEFELRSKTGNANSITIEAGASNGYAIFGATDGKVTLPKAGDFVHMGGNESLEDVDATHKTLDITGTGSQVLQGIIVAG